MELLIFLILFLVILYIFPFAFSRWLREWDSVLKEFHKFESDKPKTVTEALTLEEDRMSKDLRKIAEETEIPISAWVGSPEPDQEAKQMEAEAMKREREAREKLGPTPTVIETNE